MIIILIIDNQPHKVGYFFYKNTHQPLSQAIGGRKKRKEEKRKKCRENTQR